MIVVAAEPSERRTAQGVHVMPIARFCDRLWRTGL